MFLETALLLHFVCFVVCFCFVVFLGGGDHKVLSKGVNK